MVYAVLGNHDYGLGSKEDSANQETAERVRSMLSEIEIKILNNESVALTMIEDKVREEEGADNTLYLAGIGSNWAKDDNVSKTLSSFPEDAPRFIMMHNPRTIPSLPENTAPVAVAGHTHGGQFRLPFTPQFSYLDLESEEEVHVDGWIEKKFGTDQNRLYVNRGIGMSIVPMRFNCPPEITVFSLKSQ